VAVTGVVTVEQIAAATGLSRRSFHRYFSSKEDVLGQWFVEMGQQIAAALAARPPEERPWLALRRAFDDLVQGMSARPETLDIARMLLNTPALHCSHLQKHAHWRGLLADVLQQRLTEGARGPARIAAVALAGAALASLDSAQSEWVSEGNQRPLQRSSQRRGRTGRQSRTRQGVCRRDDTAEAVERP
jgi:AcrR family transcriptional regulator